MWHLIQLTDSIVVGLQSLVLNGLGASALAGLLCLMIQVTWYHLSKNGLLPIM